jgi:hypothetical protein
MSTIQMKEFVTMPSMWINITNLARNVTQDEKASTMMTVASIVDSVLTWVTLAVILFLTGFLVVAMIVRWRYPEGALRNRIKGRMPRLQNVETMFLALILIVQLVALGICGSEIFREYGLDNSLIILAVIAAFAAVCTAVMIYDRLIRGRGPPPLGEIFCIVMQSLIICLTLVLCYWIAEKMTRSDSVMSTWERILSVLKELPNSCRTHSILCILTAQLRLTVFCWWLLTVGMGLRKPMLGSEKKGPNHADSNT